MTCYLSKPGVECEISTFFVNIFKNRSKFKKMKKPILDNFILFLKINESHFLIKPNFCYAVQEKIDGYHGYWWISRKPHNFTNICGHHWIHLVFLIPEMYTFVHFCANRLRNEMHKKSHFLFKAWVDTNLKEYIHYISVTTTDSGIESHMFKNSSSWFIKKKKDWKGEASRHVTFEVNKNSYYLITYKLYCFYL